MTLRSSLLVIFLGLGLTQSALAQTSNEGLVASYPFQGNAADATANGNDAEIHDAIPTKGHDGSAEGAYLLKRRR